MLAEIRAHETITVMVPECWRIRNGGQDMPQRVELRIVSAYTLCLHTALVGVVPGWRSRLQGSLGLVASGHRCTMATYSGALVHNGDA